MADKLIITKPDEKRDGVNSRTIKVSAKSYALLEALSKESERPISYIADRLIEFAFDFVEIAEGGGEDG